VCLRACFDDCGVAIDEMLRVKVATPQTILNYAAYLEGLQVRVRVAHRVSTTSVVWQHWEKAFQVFEKGVTTFPFPFARDLWAAYLSKFVARYGGRKLERARDLFEQVECIGGVWHVVSTLTIDRDCAQAIAAAPAADATLFYLQYAALEEKYGLARHAMTIYERATTAVPPACVVACATCV
jgi:pre-mRNA-splicing factor SYF1